MSVGGRIRALPRNVWTLERFGLSPSKFRRRVSNPGAPRVLCVSIPKAGTHLLERALCLHPALYRRLTPTVTNGALRRWGSLEGLVSRLRPGQVIVSHLRFDPAFPEVLARHRLEVVFLVRDPRDLVISQANYVAGRDDHRFHAAFANRADQRSRLELAITGDPAYGLRSVGERLAAYEGWLATGALLVRFEDLIGAGGGGDPRVQAATVRAIYDHIGARADDALVRSVCGRLFSPDSPTFRKGAIGQWKALFDEDLERLFEARAGSAMARYGYRASDEGLRPPDS